MYILRHSINNFFYLFVVLTFSVLGIELSALHILDILGNCYTTKPFTVFSDKENIKCESYHQKYLLLYYSTSKYRHCFTDFQNQYN